MLTQLYPSAPARCTGAALDPTHILTAAHCVPVVERAITPGGQEARVVAAELADHDMAILELDEALWITEFASLAPADFGTMGAIYGTCPYFWGHQPRWALYVGPVVLETPAGTRIDYDRWRSANQSNSVCGGDSGGVIMQGNRVVGVISMVDSWYYFVAYGQEFYTVPGYLAQEFREEVID